MTNSSYNQKYVDINLEPEIEDKLDTIYYNMIREKTDVDRNAIDNINEYLKVDFDMLLKNKNFGGINKNIISKDENISFKLNKNELLNDSSKNLITEKTDNDKFEIKKETENNFSSLLNDTNGFNKMLSELKEEKKQEDKDFEKQKEKNEYSNLWLSIERKLDINTNKVNLLV